MQAGSLLQNNNSQDKKYFYFRCHVSVTRINNNKKSAEKCEQRDLCILSQMLHPEVAGGQGDLNPRWKSKIDTHAPEYKKNRLEMEGLVDELHERLRLSLNQGDPKSINRHLQSGQLLGALHFYFLLLLSFFYYLLFVLFIYLRLYYTAAARDRIELVLDQDSPYLELMPLAGYGQDGIELGGSLVGGIGLVWYTLGVLPSTTTHPGGAHSTTPDAYVSVAEWSAWCRPA
jgi:hypothetical protein